MVSFVHKFNYIISKLFKALRKPPFINITLCSSIVILACKGDIYWKDLSLEEIEINHFYCDYNVSFLWLIICE